MSDEELELEARWARERGELDRARLFDQILVARARARYAAQEEMIAERARQTRAVILPTALELAP